MQLFFGKNILDCIYKVVVDRGKKIVVKWNIRDKVEADLGNMLNSLAAGMGVIRCSIF